MPKLSDATKRFQQGAFILIAEYRGFKPDSMRYRDKKTGARVVRPIAIHSLEVGDAQVKVTEWLPDETPVDAAGLPVVDRKHQKGDRVIFQFDKVEQVQGQFTASGKIHAIDKE